ncbi:MAG: glutamine amidotransferase [Pigmentiphaga sp.]
MLPLFILQTGNPPQAVRTRHGDFQAMFGTLLAPLGRPLVAARGYAGEPLPDPGSVAGAVITGSPGNITDAVPWMDEAAEWVRRAHAAGLPLFGVCFGHQLMAHALGGRVDYHPRGREVATQPIELTEAAGNDPWLRGTPRQFAAQLLHEQTVIEPPPGATVLGANVHDAHQILRYGVNAVSVQFHPEFSAPIMREYLDIMAERLTAEGLDVPALRADVRDAPIATGLLSAFFAVQPLT